LSKNCVYVNKTTYEVLGKVATEKSLTRSMLVNNLVKQLALGDDSVCPVILLVPQDVLGSDNVEEWLLSRARGLAETFASIKNKD